MSAKNIIKAAALAAIATGFIAGTAQASEKEKCYGVSKAAKNDCASGKNSCAGSATVDSQGDAFIAVPKGLCDRLVGGSLTVKK